MKSISDSIYGCKHALTALLILVFAATAVKAEPMKTMLLINSYSENAPWSQAFTQPINQQLSEQRGIHLEIVNLNSIEITDSAAYKQISDKIFEAYIDNNPDYVIMLGNFAFTLRDRIKDEWGADIPMLLISRIDKYAPLDYYFAGYENADDWYNLPTIQSIRQDYNMTMIETPDFFRENIDLIHNTIPNINKLVFIGDQTFTNRALDKRIRNYLKDKYPNLEYEWLRADSTAIHKYQDYMLNPYPNTGFLISTWNNHGGGDMFGLMGGNLYMMSSSVNPIFSTREAYLSIGAFGGVFHDTERTSEALSYVIDKMLNGEDMRNLPLFVTDEPKPVINHHRMKMLGFETSDFPDNTRFVYRAPSIWESYRAEIISAVIILVLLVIGIIIYLTIQRKRINLLKTHAQFISNMPWAYSRAKILYDDKGQIYDIEYMFADMNNVFRALLSDNQIPGMEWKMFPLNFISDKVAYMIETGKPLSFTYHFEKTDSYYEFLLCRINPKRLKEGERPQNVDIFANDITKRIRTQRKLRMTMRTLDMTLNVARIIPWQWDLKTGVIKYDGFHTIQGIKSTDDYDAVSSHYTITEAEIIDSVHPDDKERITEILNGFKSGKISHKRTEFKIMMRKFKKVRIDWVEINAAVTETDANDHPKTVLGSLLIITQRKKQEEALIEAKEQASESDRMKSAFLANMSHEIRTPLNAIVGFSGLITQTEDKEKKQQYSAIIEHNNDLLLHLINDVLDLAKIESNTLELNIVDTDINDLMRSIYDTVRLRIAKGVVFNMVLGADTCNIRTDPNRLSQVLINLLTNSAKFTSKGSITYGYEVNDDEIEFFVQDTGIGISKENQRKLFQRFSKLNNFVQGTGLGLSICKSFVEKMGGSIWVKSRGEGKGATFYFTHPYIHAEQAPHLEITEGSIIETPKSISNDEQTIILVAEDNESNYTLFNSILSPHFHLLHAYNGQEAVEMYKEHKPQLILMDIRMPVMDGFEATREIRKLSTSVPIIAVTAHAFVTDRDRILKSGFNAYVAKPINHKDLMFSINSQLSKRVFVF